MINIDETLVDMDHTALFTMAEWHDRQATILRARAHVLLGRSIGEDQISRRLEYIKDTPKIVMKYLRHGCSLEEATDKAAKDASVPLATIQKHWHQFIMGKNKMDMGQRNRLIMDLAGIGLTNAQIGDRVGLHPVSVSRIISKTSRARLSFRRGEYPTLRVLESPSEFLISGHNSGRQLLSPSCPSSAPTVSPS